MTELLQAKHLTIGLPPENNPTIVVDALNFHIHPGETLALLGESGCGKSITAASLMRLLPLNSAYGLKSEVLLGDVDLLTLSERKMRDFRGVKMAMVFQDPMMALNPVLSIQVQLTEAITLHQAVNGARLKALLFELLDTVELKNPERILQSYPHQLSGGQKQRVVIAIALANNPELLIADEPTTALDVTTQARILELLKKIQQQRQMSLLLITHDLGVVKTMATRVCVMYAGQLVEEALVGDFFANPKHPYSQQLLASLPSFEQRSTPLSTLSGSVPSPLALPAGCHFHPRCLYAFDPCDKQKPLLQSIDNRAVRCHLYPELSQLPPLMVEQKEWKNTSLHPDTPLLIVKDLSVHFETSKRWFKKKQPLTAVDGVSFELYAGQTLALVGESGCGKTTVSRAMLRLLTANAGEIRYQDKNIHRFNARQLKAYRHEVQLIFQDPFSSMNPRFTVGDIIAEGMIAQGKNKAYIAKELVTLLDRVQLPKESLNRYPHQFSGGQRQRIGIARALATRPQILICDEPTSALDISVQAQILNLLRWLQEEYQMSYLFVTHNMAVVAYMAHQVMVMKGGRIIEAGSAEQILQRPKEAYTQELLASVLIT